MQKWTLSSSSIDAQVIASGAMLGPVSFRLPSGRVVEPLKVAPWSGRREAAGLPAVMRYLRGEFACVPFGAPAPSATVSEEWRRLHRHEPAFVEVHGPAANATWTLVEVSSHHVHVALDYPAEHPIARVERRVQLDDVYTQIAFTLELFPRRDCSLAVGVHPVFELGEQSGETDLELPFRFGRTFPGDYAPGMSRLAHGARFTSLAAVPKRDGTALDLSRHPLPFAAEEVVQLCDAQGWARLRRPSAGYAVSLFWDKQHFPSVVLGVANAGRAAPPFDSSWRALYLEPVAAAFGIGSTIGSNPHNPIAIEGVATALKLRESVPWRTSYRMSVEEL
jgi:hypothetical protein